MNPTEQPPVKLHLIEDHAVTAEIEAHPPLDLLEPGNIQLHWDEVRAWEDSLSRGSNAQAALHNSFETFSRRYGFDFDGSDIYRNFVNGFDSVHSLHPNFAFFRAHIYVVASTNQIGPNDKVTMLRRTAALLTEGGDVLDISHSHEEPLSPVNGRKIILKQLGYLQNHLYQLAAEGQAPWSSYQYFYDLREACRQQIPKVGFGEMMKRIAEAKSGVQSKTLLGAMAMLEATEALERQAEWVDDYADRQQRRADRERDKAMKHLEKAEQLEETIRF